MESEKVMSKKDRKKVSDILCNNIILKISSVVLAIVLWLLVINIDDPQVTTTIKNVPVEILNDGVITDNNEVYDILSGDKIDVKVTGPRTIVDSLKKSDFTATADFKDLSKTNAVPIDVTINNSRYEAKVTISDKSDNAMHLSIETVISREYPITIQYKGTLAANYVVYNIESDIDSVTIKAPESIHQNIANVMAVASFGGNETGDFSYTANVVIYDVKGNVMDKNNNHMEISEMYIPVQGKVYYKKTVNINYNIVDELSDGKILMQYDSSLKSVDIAGKKEVIENIEEIKIPENLTVVTDEKTEIEINLNDILPEGVYLYGSDGILKITAITEEIIQKTINIKVKSIGIQEIPEGYEGSIVDEGSIDVVVSGRQEDLEKLDAKKLLPYLDLSNAKEGDNVVRVDVVLPDNVELVSEINVTVTLTKKETETTTDTESDTTTIEPETSGKEEPTEDSTEVVQTPTNKPIDAEDEETTSGEQNTTLPEE